MSRRLFYQIRISLTVIIFLFLSSNLWADQGLAVSTLRDLNKEGIEMGKYNVVLHYVLKSSLPPGVEMETKLDPENPNQIIININEDLNNYDPFLAAHIPHELLHAWASVDGRISYYIPGDVPGTGLFADEIAAYNASFFNTQHEIEQYLASGDGVAATKAYGEMKQYLAFWTDALDYNDKSVSALKTASMTELSMLYSRSENSIKVSTKDSNGVDRYLEWIEPNPPASVLGCRSAACPISTEIYNTLIQKIASAAPVIDVYRPDDEQTSKALAESYAALSGALQTQPSAFSVQSQVQFFDTVNSSGLLFDRTAPSDIVSYGVIGGTSQISTVDNGYAVTSTYSDGSKSSFSCFSYGLCHKILPDGNDLNDITYGPPPGITATVPVPITASNADYDTISSSAYRTSTGFQQLSLLNVGTNTYAGIATTFSDSSTVVSVSTNGYAPSAPTTIDNLGVCLLGCVTFPAPVPGYGTIFGNYDPSTSWAATLSLSNPNYVTDNPDFGNTSWTSTGNSYDFSGGSYDPSFFDSGNSFDFSGFDFSGGW